MWAAQVCFMAVAGVWYLLILPTHGFFAGNPVKITPATYSSGTCQFRPKICRFMGDDDNDDIVEEANTSASVQYEMDPESEEARRISSRLGMSLEQHEKLVQLASLVVEWNERINLVSRKDCRPNVIFGRHILPSIALARMPDCPFVVSSSSSDSTDRRIKVVDVGTGGGFPGLPLAILYPNVDFMLVDSVGKKLKAVADMAEELKLSNVRIHHGRAEEMVEDILEGDLHRGAYDVCVGRSVAALPTFCFWVSDLLTPQHDKNTGGQLVYIIGGDISKELLSKAKADIPINTLLEQDDASDKRILVFGQRAVVTIAAESGEVKRKHVTPSESKKKKVQTKAKGQWAKRGDAHPKQRGYEDFKRYGS